MRYGEDEVIASSLCIAEGTFFWVTSKAFHIAEVNEFAK
jgi:hypothetical protein